MATLIDLKGQMVEMKMALKELTAALKKAPETEKVSEEVKEVKKAPKKEKNIPRWGKDTHGEQLRKALDEVCIDITDAHEKKFRKYAETLSADEWKRDSKTYIDHMREFANSIAAPDV